MAKKYINYEVFGKRRVLPIIGELVASSNNLDVYVLIIAGRLSAIIPKANVVRLYIPTIEG